MIADYTDLVGIPYIENGRTLRGLDCFGLVIECMKRRGIKIPDPFYLKYKSAIPPDEWQDWLIDQFAGWKKIDEPHAGSVVIFAKHGRPDHAGVMIDHQRFIHALKKIGVVIGRLDRCPYQLMGFYDYTDGKRYQIRYTNDY